MAKPDKGPLDVPTAPRFDAVRYVIQGGRPNRWIWANCCTWCGVLVQDQAKHLTACTGKAS
jgi:hypothetical protein